MLRYIFFLFLFLPFIANSQTQNVISWDRYAITGSLALGKDSNGRTDPATYAHPSAILQLGRDTSNKGFLPTRVLHEDSIPDPIQGMLTYAYSCQCFVYYDGLTWKRVSGSGVPTGNDRQILTWDALGDPIADYLSWRHWSDTPYAAPLFPVGVAAVFRDPLDTTEYQQTILEVSDGTAKPNTIPMYDLVPGRDDAIALAADALVNGDGVWASNLGDSTVIGTSSANLFFLRDFKDISSTDKVLTVNTEEGQVSAREYSELPYMDTVYVRDDTIFGIKQGSTFVIGKMTGGGGSVTAGWALTQNPTGTFNVDSSLVHKKGGNAFGMTDTIGTLDNFRFFIITNRTPRIEVGSDSTVFRGTRRAVVNTVDGGLHFYPPATGGFGNGIRWFTNGGVNPSFVVQGVGDGNVYQRISIATGPDQPGIQVFSTNNVSVGKTSNAGAKFEVQGTSATTGLATRITNSSSTALIEAYNSGRIRIAAPEYTGTVSSVYVPDADSIKTASVSLLPFDNKSTYNYGNSTYDPSSGTVAIAHGLSGVPSYINFQFSDYTYSELREYEVSVDGTNITITFANAPSISDLKIWWEARLSR